jgi:hypothetical protein
MGQGLADNQQVVSKQRVADFGEVYTSEREVNAMLDLVKHETERIESRFLEPACGTGNFLIEVLRRKLKIVGKRYQQSQGEYELYSILALSSMYGIDILEDNVIRCRGRLFNYFTECYMGLFGLYSSDDLLKTATYILEKNIIWGDALTLQTVEDNPTPIHFAEWEPVSGQMIKRRDFTFFDLLHSAETNALPLFSDLGEDVYLPNPMRDYPLAHFKRLYEYQ